MSNNKEKMEMGVMAGYPMVDMKVAVYDGSYHDVDSSDIAFKIAASMALETASKNAQLVLLEPIMKVEVTVPEEFMGSVIGDLKTRRAKIVEMGNRGNLKTARCEVPLAEMLGGYSTILRSMTKGRASYSMDFECYREVPKNVEEAVLGKK